MPEVKLPSERELDVATVRVGMNEPLTLSETMAMIRGCREAIRLEAERAKLAKLWARAWSDQGRDALNALLDAIAAEESGEGER